MPRYYFVVHHAFDIEAYEGIELPGREAALEEARATARELLSEGVKIGRDRRNWSIQILDERGLTVAIVQLGDTVELDHLAGRPRKTGGSSAEGDH